MERAGIGLLLELFFIYLKTYTCPAEIYSPKFVIHTQYILYILR